MKNIGVGIVAHIFIVRQIVDMSLINLFGRSNDVPKHIKV